MGMNLDIAIRIFANFINDTWNTVMPLIKGRDYTSDESSISDWLQSNWEILVERKVLKINQFLEVYGEGADFNGASSRITDINALPSFTIQVNQFSKEKVFDLLNDEYVSISNADFIELVSFEDGFYSKTPKFDSVLIEDSTGTERVILIDEIKFVLKEIID
jgi:hypothetical protein